MRIGCLLTNQLLCRRIGLIGLRETSDVLRDQRTHDGGAVVKEEALKLMCPVVMPAPQDEEGLGVGTPPVCRAEASSLLLGLTLGAHERVPAVVVAGVGFAKGEQVTGDGIDGVRSSRVMCVSPWT